MYWRNVITTLPNISTLLNPGQNVNTDFLGPRFWRIKIDVDSCCRDDGRLRLHCLVFLSIVKIDHVMLKLNACSMAGMLDMGMGHREATWHILCDLTVHSHLAILKKQCFRKYVSWFTISPQKSNLINYVEFLHFSIKINDQFALHFMFDSERILNKGKILQWASSVMAWDKQITRVNISCKYL